MWLDKVKKAYGDNLNITWRNFSLEQNAHNLKEGLESDWKVWDDDDPAERRSLVAQIAAEAAKRQGDEAHAKFHLALLTARHGGEGRLSLSDEDAILEVAANAGLDTGRMRRGHEGPGTPPESSVRTMRQPLPTESLGTPTYIFENGNMAYLKAFIPEDEDAVASFEHYIALANHRNYFGEIKRPQPPWPRGVPELDI